MRRMICIIILHPGKMQYTPAMRKKQVYYPLMKDHNDKHTAQHNQDRLNDNKTGKIQGAQEKHSLNGEKAQQKQMIASFKIGPLFPGKDVINNSGRYPDHCIWHITGMLFK